ncbi:hypothetical protein GCM10017691_60660 [Pseudonocardia petroleophila]|uniref:MobF family relaxase n=1 Tax=Pseudonocardia petroleophila TaxID=37331 RepID=UPI0021031725|nr:MobF family relaxase [Pseudonocardia petroleophila]
MLSIASGYSPEYLLKEVATGRENYYTGAVAEGEPPGRWWGAGAEKLGLTGLVDAQDMRAVYERYLDPRADGFRDIERWDEVDTLGHTGRRYMTEDELYNASLEREPDASAERRSELRLEAGRNARHNVAFFDATFSVQKSVTLIHTAFEAQEVAARNAGDHDTEQAWAAFRQSVEDAIWAGNNAGLAYLAEHAGYSRVGHHGGAAGRYVDAHGLVVASFFQHDSRDHDPQLHIHNGILNRVEGPDGTWRTIDGRGLYRWRAAAAAVAERTTEERLTHALGMLIATRPDGKAREIVGVAQEAMDLISSRRRAVTAKAQELIDAYETRHGRAANSAERDRLSRQATFATRRAKSHEWETREQVLDRVDGQLRADIDGGLDGVAHAALAARGQGQAPREWSPQAVIETALADVQERKAAWTASDLASAINRALPDYLGIPDGAQVGKLLDQLTDDALAQAVPLDAARPGAESLPDVLRRENGESTYQAHGAQLYSTPEHVRTERVLAAARIPGGAAALRPEVAKQFLEDLRESGLELGVDQAAAVRGVLTSGAHIESLVGPAGTGKSFVVGTIARCWTQAEQVEGEQARRVFGLATSQIATDVLTAEGLTARNVARWLATQERLATGTDTDGPRPVAGDEAWRLHAGDLVVVDESAMTDTPALVAIQQRVEAAGAKLLLVGDHRQLSAVGAGGGMELLAAAGGRYELAEARRFTAEWEREASLRLRAGDTDVLRDYHEHGRLLDAGTRGQAETSAARGWLADTLSDQRSLLLVDDNEQAARLSAQLRAELIRLGQVDEHGVALGMQGTFAGVGDLVQARRNGWDLAGLDGNRRGPINRETYRVTALRPDGGLDVTTALSADGAEVGERMVLPASYVAEHLTLGYALTVHAAQGQTVDTSHSVVTASTSPAAVYVAMSRGRDANTAHVTTHTGAQDPAQGREHETLHRDPIAVLAGVLADADHAVARSALATATESADDLGSVRAAAELLADAAQMAATERTATWLDQLVANGALSAEQRGRIAADDGAASLARVLRRAELAGHDPRQVLHEAIADRPLDDARNPTNVVYSRITTQYDRQLDPTGTAWTDWIPRTDNAEWKDYLTVLASRADERAAELGRQTAATEHAWAVEAFGPVPTDPIERSEWEIRAGTVAAYRELRGHDDTNEALGPSPQPGQPEAYAAYRAAWRALGRPEIDREELELSDGQLRMRVRAWERELTWAPRYVSNELAGTRQAADRHREIAALRTAESTTAHPDDLERLQREAREAAALADTLDVRAGQLQEVDDARAAFLAHTAGSRVRAERSKAELALRHVDDAEPEQRVTAEEWLDAHDQAVAADDRYLEITESDLATDDHHRTEHRDDDVDVREIAADEPRAMGEDAVRVPSADETADSIDGARRSLAEIRAREALDGREASEHRAAELAHWHADDQAAVDEHTDEHEFAYGDY